MPNLARTERLLDVNVRLGRRVILAKKPTRVQVLVETRPLASAHDAPPVDIRLILDRSGSMAGAVGHGESLSKFGAAHDAIEGLVGELTPTDRVLLASFDDENKLHVRRSHADSRVRAEVHRVMDEIMPRGSTFISGGLRHGLETAGKQGELARVILFTDGQSTTNVATDLIDLVKLADKARRIKVPLLIYGTGSDYNWHLLKQLVARASNGSFLKHVLDMRELRDHLIGELAFLRGTAIDQLVVSGTTAQGVKIISVTAMAPLQRDLVNRDEPGAEDVRDYFRTDRFTDAAGSMDTHRGQQYLIELEVDDPRAGIQPLIKLTFKGRSMRRFVAFSESVNIRTEFTSDATQESPVDARVLRIVQMMAAARKAAEGEFKKAEKLFRAAGDPVTADRMSTLVQQSLTYGADMEDLRRRSTTLGTASITESYRAHRRTRGRRSSGEESLP